MGGSRGDVKRRACDVGEAKEGLESDPSVALPTSQLILQSLRCFTYVTAHSPILTLLHLRHSSAHSPNLPSLHLRHSSFSKPFRRFTYVTAHSPILTLLHLRHSSGHSPNFPSLHLRHSSFSNPSVGLPTSQLILQPFRCFIYVTVHSPTL